jgi:thymidylate kinase
MILYESFVQYQNRIMAQFDQMVEGYGFRVIDASPPIEAVFADLKGQMSDVLNNWARSLGRTHREA